MRHLQSKPCPRHRAASSFRKIGRNGSKFPMRPPGAGSSWGVLFDSHNHLQDERLLPWRAELLAELPGLGIAEVVVNGTGEQDWPAVAELARLCPRVRPSFGLHPWQVGGRGPQWREKLADWLHEFPAAAVGEIGLDRWIHDPDIEAQRECFLWQLELAARLDRAVTIHCLRAWGLLEELLRAARLPARGFLLHSYGGPAEMVPGFVQMGAYFSCSPWFGHPAKAAKLAVFKTVPADRLLAETDAPDMAPPDALNARPLHHEGRVLNHPANLAASYGLLAQARGEPLEGLVERIAANHRRLFGPPFTEKGLPVHGQSL